MLCHRSPLVSWYEACIWDEKIYQWLQIDWGRWLYLIVSCHFIPLLCVGFRCALPCTNLRQVGASTLDSSLGRIHDMSMILSLWKLMCTSCSWIVDSLAFLR